MRQRGEDEDKDNAAIMARINAADPAITQPPASVEELIDVAELAERKLVAATDPNDVVRERRMAVAPWGARGMGGLVLKGRF